MAQKIEVDPFIRQDVMGIFEENTTELFLKPAEDETAGIGAIPNYRYENVMEEIFEKLTEFINENYTPKP